MDVLLSIVCAVWTFSEEASLTNDATCLGHTRVLQREMKRAGNEQAREEKNWEAAEAQKRGRQ